MLVIESPGARCLATMVMTLAALGAAPPRVHGVPRQILDAVPAELQSIRSDAGVQFAASMVPADLTGDGRIDAQDAAAFAFLMRADVTRDGRIDAADRVIVDAARTGVVPDLMPPIATVDASDMAAFAWMKARADLTADGITGAADLLAFDWMRDRADLNRDGVVDLQDRDALDAAQTPFAPRFMDRGACSRPPGS